MHQVRGCNQETFRRLKGISFCLSDVCIVPLKLSLVTKIKNTEQKTARFRTTAYVCAFMRALTCKSLKVCLKDISMFLVFKLAVKWNANMGTNLYERLISKISNKKYDKVSRWYNMFTWETGKNKLHEMCPVTDLQVIAIGLFQRKGALLERTPLMFV